MSRSAYATDAEPILELRGVRAAYGRIEVLHGVDLALPPGSVTAVLGPNGAGKTTTLPVIAGLLPASDGDVLAGRPAGERRPGRRPRPAWAVPRPRGQGRVPQPHGAREPPGGDARRPLAAPRSRRTPTAASPASAQRRTQLAGTLSGGEQQMLALARAVATRSGRAAARRAVDGAGAARRGEPVRGGRGDRPRRASPFSSSSSSPDWCSTWPTRPPSWCKDG